MTKNKQITLQISSLEDCTQVKAKNEGYKI